MRSRGLSHADLTRMVATRHHVCAFRRRALAGASLPRARVGGAPIGGEGGGEGCPITTSTSAFDGMTLDDEPPTIRLVLRRATRFLAAFSMIARACFPLSLEVAFLKFAMIASFQFHRLLVSYTIRLRHTSARHEP